MRFFLIFLLIGCMACTEQKPKPNFLVSDIHSTNRGGKATDHKQLADLSGVYTLGGHHTSWFIILKPNAKNYDALFCEVYGMLPPKEYLIDKFDQLPVVKLKYYYINPMDLSFESSMGKGQITFTEGLPEIIFLEKLSHLNQPLKLTFNPAYQGSYPIDSL